MAEPGMPTETENRGLYSAVYLDVGGVIPLIRM